MPFKKIEGSNGITTRDVVVGALGQGDWEDARSENQAGMGGANVIESGANYQTTCQIHASFLAIAGGVYRIRRQLAVIDFSAVVPQLPQGVGGVKLQLS